MKIKLACMLRLTVFIVAFLLASIDFAGAATTETIFADTWSEAVSDNSIATNGTFSMNITLPLDGVDLSEADPNSQFSLSIGGIQIYLRVAGAG